MFRKVTYALYPSATQEAALLDMKGSHQRLFNMALEQRVSAWRRCGVTVRFGDQCRDLTALRAAEPEYGQINAQSAQVTLKRLDLAMAGFLRRVKRGETPGFPRFKSFERFSGWGYKTHGDGWKLHPGEGFKHGHIRLSGIGNVPMRGKARLKGEPVTCEILHRDGRWVASVTLRCRESRECGNGVAGFDWGVSTFLTICHEDGRQEEIQNPKWLKQAEEALEAAQQALSRKQGPPTRRKPSQRWRKARARLGRLHWKVANRRLNFLHQTAKRLVDRFGFVAIEELDVKAMTESARGTLEAPGQDVRRKAGLNRGILDSAPAAFMTIWKSKAEEAAAEWVDVPTRSVKPTQTCASCGHQAKKTLGERIHVCRVCGHTAGRDANASEVCLNWALWGQSTGREPARRGGAA
jgi:putative transposase